MSVAGQNPPAAVETGRASIPAPIAVPATSIEAVKTFDLTMEARLAEKVFRQKWFFRYLGVLWNRKLSL
jgi:hypothetical protein